MEKPIELPTSLQHLRAPLLLKTDETGDICFPPEIPLGQLCFVKTPGYPNRTFIKMEEGWDEVKSPEVCPHCHQEIRNLYLEPFIRDGEQK